LLCLPFVSYVSFSYILVFRYIADTNIFACLNVLWDTFAFHQQAMWDEVIETFTSIRPRISGFVSKQTIQFSDSQEGSNAKVQI